MGEMTVRREAVGSYWREETGEKGSDCEKSGPEEVTGERREGDWRKVWKKRCLVSSLE